MTWAIFSIHPSVYYMSVHLSVTTLVSIVRNGSSHNLTKPYAHCICTSISGNASIREGFSSLICGVVLSDEESVVDVWWVVCCDDDITDRGDWGDMSP